MINEHFLLKKRDSYCRAFHQLTKFKMGFLWIIPEN